MKRRILGLLFSLFFMLGISFTTTAQSLNDIFNEIDSADSNNVSVNTQDVKSKYNLLKQVLGFLGIQVNYDVAIILNPLFYVDKISAGTKNIFEIMTTKTMASVEEQLKITPIALIGTIILMGVVMYVFVNLRVGNSTEGGSAKGGMGGGGLGGIGGGFGMGNMSSGETTADMNNIRVKDVFSKIYQLVKSQEVDEETRKIAKLLLISGLGFIVATIFLGSASFDYALTLAKNFKILTYSIVAVLTMLTFYYAVFLYTKFLLAPIVSFATQGGSEENIFTNIIIRGVIGLVAIPIVGGIISLIISILLSV